MKHLGDITKISGYTAPMVDVIIGGSPCQGLSVAGKRKGLDDERSGLFMEQIRIVKEMRANAKSNGRANHDVCRFLVWENVPGALSSGTPNGEDFRCVLEELARIVEEGVVIPRPPKGKWSNSGCIIGDGYSIAWRIMDSQYWGVPQRRRRIALVADFGGYNAPRIVFGEESSGGMANGGGQHSSVGYIGGDGRQEVSPLGKGVSGHPQSRLKKGKGTSPDAEGSPLADHREGVGFDGYNGDLTGDVSATLGVNCGLSSGRNGVIEEARAYTLKIRSGCEGGGKGALVQTEKSATLATNNDQYLFQPVHTFSKSKRAQSATDYETWQESDTANTLNAFDTGDVRTTDVVVGLDAYNQSLTGDKAKTLNSAATDTDHIPAVVQSFNWQGAAGAGLCVEENIVNPVACTRTPAVVYALDRAAYNQGKNAQYDFEVSDKGINSPLVAKGPSAVCYSVDQGGGKSACNVTEGQAPTLTCTHGGEPAVCYGIDQQGGKGGANYTEDVAPTILSDSHGTPHAVCYEQQRTRYIVRRLTPNECEALQGFPQNWTDIGEWTDSKGKKHQSSDAARYKALGNSISLPNWKWLLKRLSACYERDATMASLFDGIGGFPWLWEQINGKGSCLWASEVEDFCIAVTERRINNA